MTDEEKLEKGMKELQDFFDKKTPFYVIWKLRLQEYMWKYLPMWEIYRRWYMFLIWLFGFRLVKCVDYGGEFTFIFKTPEEAKKAHKMLEERDGRQGNYLVIGWWYGEKEFDKIKDEQY